MHIHASFGVASQARNYVLLVAFVVGLCLGIVVAERTYIQRRPSLLRQSRNLILDPHDIGVLKLRPSFLSNLLGHHTRRRVGVQHMSS
jgi:hypothetical protein